MPPVGLVAERYRAGVSLEASTNIDQLLFAAKLLLIILDRHFGQPSNGAFQSFVFLFGHIAKLIHANIAKGPVPSLANRDAVTASKRRREQPASPQEIQAASLSVA